MTTMALPHNESMLKIWRNIKDRKEGQAQAAFACGDLGAARRYADQADVAEEKAGEFARRVLGR